MRVLFTFAGGSGHADPLVPIAEAVRAAGHDVAFFGRRSAATVLIGDDPSRLTFEALGTYTDTVTRKPVANITRYTYGTDAERYVVTFTRHRDLSRNRMIEGLHGVKRAAAELLRFDGAYMRFSGEVRVEHYVGGEIVDQYVTEDAIWELMYFGHARA